MKKTIVFYRSSVTGRRVKKAYAENHPKTTEREIHKKKNK